MYVQGAEPIYTQLGFTSLSYNPPRMFGFNVKYRFSMTSSSEMATAAYNPAAGRRTRAFGAEALIGVL